MLRLVIDTNIVVSALLKPDSLPDLIVTSHHQRWRLEEGP